MTAAKIKNKKQAGIPADSLILQTFCSFSQAACFFLPRISSKLINFGEWLWKSGITVANFIPLKFRHSWYIWSRLYFWDSFSQISSYSFSCSPIEPAACAASGKRGHLTNYRGKSHWLFIPKERPRLEKRSGGTPGQWVSVLPASRRERDPLDQMKGKQESEVLLSPWKQFMSPRLGPERRVGTELQDR